MYSNPPNFPRQFLLPNYKRAITVVLMEEKRGQTIGLALFDFQLKPVTLDMNQGLRQAVVLFVVTVTTDSIMTRQYLHLSEETEHILLRYT